MNGSSEDPLAVLVDLRSRFTRAPLDGPAADALLGAVEAARSRLPAAPARLVAWVGERLEEDHELASHPYARAVLFEALDRAAEASRLERGRPVDDELEALEVAWRSVAFSITSGREGPAPDPLEALAARLCEAPAAVTPEELEAAREHVPAAGEPLIAWAAATHARHRPGAALDAVAPVVAEALARARGPTVDAPAELERLDDVVADIEAHYASAPTFVGREEDHRWPLTAVIEEVKRLQDRLDASDPSIGRDLVALAGRVDAPSADLLRWAVKWLDRVDAETELPLLAPILGEALAAVCARLEGRRSATTVDLCEGALVDFLDTLRATTRLRLQRKRDPAPPSSTTPPPAVTVEPPAAPVEPPAPSALAPAERAAHRDFQAEAEDHLSEMDAAVERLERDGALEALEPLARAAHTLKGTSAIFGYEGACRLVHALEDLVVHARARGQALTPAQLGRLRSGIEEVRAALSRAVRRLDQGIVPSAPSAEEERAIAVSLARFAQEQAVGAPGRAAGPDADAEATTAAALTEVVRVGVERLDELAALVSELATTEAALQEALPAEAAWSAARAPLRVLRRLVRSLELTTLSLRLVPLRTVFARVRRGLDQLVRATGVDVELVVRGEEVEVDRLVAQILETSLLHLVRNGVAHGIEAPDVRARAGKAGRAVLAVRARQAGGEITVDVEDDGRGMDPAWLVARAVQLGLLRAEEAAQLGPAEARQLVFRAGFSTRADADDLAGRGVGLKAVVEALRRVGGSIDVASEVGRWTRFTMRIRSNVALLDALLVHAGAGRYLLPVSSVAHAFPLRVRHELQRLGGAEVIDVRGELTRVTRLRAWAGEAEAALSPDTCVLLLELGDDRCALLVDRIVGERRVATTDLGPYLHGVHGFAGAAVLPDGQVGLVLDVAAILGGHR